SRLASPAKEVQATTKKLARVHPVSKAFHPLLVLLGGDRTHLERHRGRPLTHLCIEAALMPLEGHESAHANVFQSGALEEPWQFSHKPAIHGAMVGERSYDPPCPVTIRMGQQDTLNRCLVSDTNYRPRLASKTKKPRGRRVSRRPRR